ncbi:MAG: hypothetical protein HC941_05470 [Microcoleus sp. SU_5_3]|nr:hypothetical protein [Microcoleus sp. SU_5_3]
MSGENACVGPQWPENPCTSLLKVPYSLFPSCCLFPIKSSLPPCRSLIQQALFNNLSVPAFLACMSAGHLLGAFMILSLNLNKYIY